MGANCTIRSKEEIDLFAKNHLGELFTPSTRLELKKKTATTSIILFVI